MRGGLLVAVAALAAALAGCGSEHPPPVPTLVSGAIAAERQGQPDGARQLFEQALKQRPTDPAVLYDLGQLDQQQGMTAAALDLYDRVLAISPHDERALYNSATILSATEPARAIANYTQVVQADPGNAAAWLNQGLLQAQLSEHAVAVSSLHRAVVLQPSYLSHVPPAYRHEVTHYRIVRKPTVKKTP